MRGLAANFVQIYVGADGRLRRESGRLLLKRPGKARWEYIEPERKIFISDGKHVYFYVFGERRATKASIRESGDLQLLFSFLLGPIQTEQHFSRIELLPRGSSGDFLLRAVPRRPAEGFREVIAQIDPASLEIRRLTVLERNGVRMDFLLSDLRENFVAPDSEFKFAPPPGVQIVER
jgi:outer membrane lipoprotein carrier protein